MKKIVVCDAIQQIGFDMLAKEKNITFFDASKVAKTELLNYIGDADVAITRSSTEINEAFLNAGKNLKAIVRAGVGVDNVDIDGCSKRGIILMNVPTANTIAAVEMTMCHLLNAARKYVNSCNDLKINKTWKREKWYGVELYKKTLGIIGFGHIGSQVGIRAKAFGMNVIAYDPYVESSKATAVGVEYTTKFEDILKCDFITIHTPKNKETINMLDDESMKKLKDGVRLINCARGGLYNEKALIKNLANGKIAYLGIDVFDKEPATEHELLKFDNVTATPHLGANTLESQTNIAIAAAEQAISAARGISYPNALNMPIKSEELPQFVEPYIDLITKMSYLASQIDKSPIKTIRIRTAGKISEYINQLLTFGIVGALKESLGDKINYVNARFIADEKGIEIKGDEIIESDYQNKVEVEITTDKNITSVCGSVFGDTEERIVNINGFKTDFKPKGKMVIFKNIDVPGVIYNISEILMGAKVNIADFRLGRNGEGQALAVILIDDDITKDTLAKLNALDTCIWAQYAVI
jgi:phosphoglycerate dehydrogenase